MNWKYFLGHGLKSVVYNKSNLEPQLAGGNRVTCSTDTGFLTLLPPEALPGITNQVWHHVPLG